MDDDVEFYHIFYIIFFIFLHPEFRNIQKLHKTCNLFGFAGVSMLKLSSLTAETAETAENQLAPRQLHDAARNVAFIAAIAATIAGSWIFTGKWWKAWLTTI